MKNATFLSAFKPAILLLSMVLLFQFSWAQQAINNSSIPQKNSIIKKETDKNNKGKPVPSVALTGTKDATSIKGTTTNLLIYNTATTGVSPNNVYPGYYHNIGTTASPEWKRVEPTVTNAVKKKQE